MFDPGKTRFVLALCVLALASAGTSDAAAISFTGSFVQDDDIRFFSFNLAASSTVTLATYSYGGGTNAAGDVIPTGGFQPVLSLFAGTGNLLATSEPNGLCPPQNADSATGLCVDAYIQQSGLDSGTYFVGLTQFFNVPNGPNLAGGFLQQGTGNFTGPSCSEPGGSFLDETCAQRTSSFALDIDGVDAAAALPGVPSAIPEPATFWLAASVIAALAASARRRRVR